MIVPACLAALAFAAGAADANRLHRAEFWLEGPLEQAVLHQVGHTARTRLEARLAAGERRLVRLPFVDAPLGERPPVIELAVPPGAVLRFERWLGDESATDALTALRPPLPSSSAAPRPAALAVAAAAAVLVLAARRGWVALAAGLAGAAGAAALQPASPGPVPEVRVLEGDLRSGGRWSVVRVARSELDVEAHSDARLVETRPAGAALEWRVDLARERWRALAPGAEIFVVAPFDPGEGPLAADRNGFADFESAFLREPAGAWRAIGAWDLGRPLPPASASGGLSPPPGWLAAGLPQGVPVLVARLREPEPDGVRRRGSDTWLRLVGFGP